MARKQVALVTGASAGMGTDFVQALLGEGLEVYAVARRTKNMKPLQEQGAHILQMDITKDKDIQDVLRQIEKTRKGVDVLVNNAGFGVYGAVEDTSIADARYQFEVNLFGLARLTQLCLPYMRKKRAGKIINISSIGGKVHTPMGAWYHASKYALEGWSDCLRAETQEFGIAVVVIQPGAIATEFADVMTQPMLKRSGKGAYKGFAKAIGKALTAQDRIASPPSVITKLVLQAVRSPRPKTRYAAGKFAKPLLFLRRWGSDRFLDRLMLRRLKSGA